MEKEEHNKTLITLPRIMLVTNLVNNAQNEFCINFIHIGEVVEDTSKTKKLRLPNPSPFPLG